MGRVVGVSNYRQQLSMLVFVSSLQHGRVVFQQKSPIILKFVANILLKEVNTWDMDVTASVEGDKILDIQLFGDQRVL